MYENLNRYLSYFDVLDLYFQNVQLIGIKVKINTDDDQIVNHIVNLCGKAYTFGIKVKLHYDYAYDSKNNFPFKRLLQELSELDKDVQHNTLINFFFDQSKLKEGDKLSIFDDIASFKLECPIYFQFKWGGKDVDKDYRYKLAHNILVNNRETLRVSRIKNVKCYMVTNYEDITKGVTNEKSELFREVVNTMRKTSYESYDVIEVYPYDYTISMGSLNEEKEGKKKEEKED